MSINSFWLTAQAGKERRTAIEKAAEHNLTFDRFIFLRSLLDSLLPRGKIVK